ncbi:MAG: hypothetical protein JF616_13930 [Fibrobacteres bacterium]|nr:hypothetical protein [Fibrobacterota bacterium]
MWIKIATAAIVIAVKGAFALDLHDDALTGVYIAKASAPFWITPTLLGEHPFRDGHWLNPFSLEAIPNDFQMVAITLPDLYVLGGIASG